MSYHFKLVLSRVVCVHGQLHEPGKDELRLFGFGMSRKGSAFSTGFRNLGSYSPGDDRSTGIFPMTLFEGDLSDDGLDVAAYLWMIEEDSGGVGEAAGDLIEKFNASWAKQAAELNGFGFPRECVPLTAFYRALLPFDAELKSAASNFWNDDDVGFPREFYFRYQGDTAMGFKGSASSSFVVSTGGHYNLFFNFSYQHQAVLLS